jgi:hypothetical protein
MGRLTSPLDGNVDVDHGDLVTLHVEADDLVGDEGGSSERALFRNPIRTVYGSSRPSSGDRPAAPRSPTYIDGEPVLDTVRVEPDGVTVQALLGVVASARRMSRDSIRFSTPWTTDCPWLVTVRRSAAQGCVIPAPVDEVGDRQQLTTRSARCELRRGRPASLGWTLKVFRGGADPGSRGRTRRWRYPAWPTDCRTGPDENRHQGRRGSLPSVVEPPTRQRMRFPATP